MNNYNYLFKFIVVGDTNVGKSSLLLQFINQRYRDEYDPTIGVEFGSKMIEKQDQLIKLQIWDTAGQESFRSITRSYYKGSTGALIVFDVSSRQSFLNIQKWLNEIREFSNEKIGLVLVGNKSDLTNREVSNEEAEEFALNNEIKYIECSAKTNFNVEKSFLQVVNIVFDRIQQGEIDVVQQNSGIKVGLRSPRAQSRSQSEDVYTKLTLPKQKSNCC